MCEPDSAAEILNAFPLYRSTWLRWLRKPLAWIGVGRYERWGGSEQQFWEVALRNIPVSYRLLGRSARLADLDARFAQWSEWQDVRARIEPGDRIYPFAFNLGTLAMRLGYVIARRGRPIGGIVVLVS